MDKPVDAEEKEEEIFYVEKILDKKTKRGKVTYLIRWQKYDSSYDSWEPLECLYGSDCTKLVDAFNKEFNEKKAAQKAKDGSNKVKASGTVQPTTVIGAKKQEAQKVQPTMIIGATDVYPNTKGWQFLIEFSDGKKKLIPRKKLRTLCPQLLINYYEQNIEWGADEWIDAGPEIPSSDDEDE